MNSEAKNSLTRLFGWFAVIFIALLSWRALREPSTPPTAEQLATQQQLIDQLKQLEVGDLLIYKDNAGAALCTIRDGEQIVIDKVIGEPGRFVHVVSGAGVSNLARQLERIIPRFDSETCAWEMLRAARRWAGLSPDTGHQASTLPAETQPTR